MKFVIRPFSTPSWISTYFDQLELLELKFCNKKLLEYYLDLLYLLECKDLLIILPYYQANVFEFLNRQNEWGIKIRIEIANDNEDYQSIENRYSTFFKDDIYSLIEGNIFIKYNQNDFDYFSDLKSRKRLFFSKDKNTENILQIDSLEMYFNTSIQINLNLKESYNIPGFFLYKNCYVGKGVIIKNYFSLTPGIHVGNYVYLHNDSILRNGAIIGNHVIIGQFVEIESSIIFDNTVVGDGICLKNKIVYENKVICPFSGAIALVDQKILLPLYDMKKYKKLLMEIVEFIFAFMMILYSIPLVTIIKLYSYYFKKNIYKEVIVKTIDNQEILVQEIDNSNLRKGSFLYFISELSFAEKFSRLFLVLKKKVKIIGPDNSASSEDCWISSVYNYSNLCRDPDLIPFRRVHDYFYQYKNNVILNFLVLFKILFSRIMILFR